MTLIAATRSVSILGSMRKAILLLVALALALPVVAAATLRTGDGTLSVENGRGKVSVQARGGLIGRLDRGSVTIFDLTPADANQPVVSGDDQPLMLIGDNGIRYRGAGIRFRVIGGGFRVVVQGRGIDLSVVGRGNGYVEGDERAFDTGLYSLAGADCRKDAASCEPLPVEGFRFKLGSPEREKAPGRDG
jgi:hypothetical protein